MYSNSETPPVCLNCPHSIIWGQRWRITRGGNLSCIRSVCERCRADVWMFTLQAEGKETFSSHITERTRSRLWLLLLLLLQAVTFQLHRRRVSRGWITSQHWHFTSRQINWDLLRGYWGFSMINAAQTNHFLKAGDFLGGLIRIITVFAVCVWCNYDQR